MPNETHERDVSQASATGGDGASPEAKHAGEMPAGVSTRRPYNPPRLRSLGKVAELTFGHGASATDGPGTKKAG